MRIAGPDFLQPRCCCTLNVEGRVASLRINRRLTLVLPTLLAPTTLPLSAAEVPTTEGFVLEPPAAWRKIDKAGANVFYENPDDPSTNVGVTVLPVMIDSLNQFGDVKTTGNRLLDVEKKKESTIDVRMLTNTQVALNSGVLAYNFEYELESTRGRKRLLSTVAIADRKLYIVNGVIKCARDSCSKNEEQIDLMRSIVHTFLVTG